MGPKRRRRLGFVALVEAPLLVLSKLVAAPRRQSSLIFENGTNHVGDPTPVFENWLSSRRRARFYKNWPRH